MRLGLRQKKAQVETENWFFFVAVFQRCKIFFSKFFLGLRLYCKILAEFKNLKSAKKKQKFPELSKLVYHSTRDAVNLHQVYHILRFADAFNLNHINRTHSSDIIKADIHEKKRTQKSRSRNIG